MMTPLQRAAMQAATTAALTRHVDLQGLRHEGTVSFAGVLIECAVTPGQITPEWDDRNACWNDNEEIHLTVDKRQLAKCPDSKVELQYQGNRFWVKTTQDQETAWSIIARRIVRTRRPSAS